MKKIAFLLIALAVSLLFTSCTQPNNDNQSPTSNILYVTATLSGTEITIKEATDGTTNQLKKAISDELRKNFADEAVITKITIVPPENGARITPEADLDSLFSGYLALTTLENFDLLDTSSVTGMSSMFSLCKRLENIEFLKGWDTSNVVVMLSMFEFCEALTEVSALKNWDTSSVTYTIHMFRGCIGLTKLDISGDGWNDSQVLDAFEMFINCDALTEAGVKVGPNITGGVKYEIEKLP